MRLKTLLLGSAAAFAFAAGSAQAADLSVAEPVDYVRVCDAFGAGYWYIPGTDTCIAISGKVTFKMGFGDSDVGASDHTSSWGFTTSTDLNVDARSMTDWGPLVAYIALTSDFTYDENDHFVMDEGYLSIGPVLMGYTDSVFDVAGGAFTNEWNFKVSDAEVNQVQLSWALNGFGLAIGIEDPRDRFGSSAEDMPVLALALSTEMGGWEAALSFIYAPNAIDDTLGVQGVIETEVGMWGFQLAAIWVDGDGLMDGKDFDSDSGVAVRASAQQNWTGQFSTAETVAWFDLDGGPSYWGFGVTAAYTMNAMTLFFDVGSEDEGDTIDFLLSAEVPFGPNG